MEFYNQLFNLFLFCLISFIAIIPIAYLAGKKAKKKREQISKNAYKNQINTIKRTGGKTVVTTENNIIVSVRNLNY